MNVLVITRESWSNNNSTGNTMTTLFEPIKDRVNIHNLYFRESVPNNDIVKTTFRISEQQIIKALTKRELCGELVESKIVNDNITLRKREKSIYASAKKIGSYIPHFIRELIWSSRVWQNDKLNNYLLSVKPDIIFMPVFPCWYAHKVLQYVYNQTGAKVLLFHTDDCYTLKQCSLYPSYWFYRFIQRKWIRKSVEISSVNYVISPIQKEEYDKIFNLSTRILTKYFDFDNVFVDKYDLHRPIRIVYTGNLHLNRWKSIRMLFNVLEEINNDDVKFELYIYSGTPINQTIINKISDNKSSFFKGSLDPNEIKKVQRNADILLHVEAFDFKNRLVVRQSFSTKIVDYLYNAKAILAIGPSEVASIDYLNRNECAFVCNDVSSIKNTLVSLIEKPELIETMAKCGVMIGKEKHDYCIMKNTFLSEFNCE